MISAEGLKEIDRAIAKYPADQKQSAVMSALAIAQEEHGWLSPEIMQFVADYLGRPAGAVQEVATCYTMYNTSPVGKHKITLITNDFGIKESFTVEVKADGVEKQIKDYSDRLPK